MPLPKLWLASYLDLISKEDTVRACGPAFSREKEFKLHWDPDSSGSFRTMRNDPSDKSAYSYFSIFPISTREDLLSVHALVNFKTVPSGQLMSKRTFVCTHPNSVSPHAPYLHCLLALTRECRIFNSSGVSSAQLDKATRSDRSLTGGISPRDIAPK